MKTTRILFYLSAITFAITVSSCKKDDDPGAKPMVSFSGKKKTVSESVGTVEVTVNLDKAYSKDITIEYSLEGTATDKENANSSNLGDYEITDDHGELFIKKGETSGIISINIINDAYYEADETITISLDNISTSDLTISEDNEYEITISNDDEKLTASFAKSTLVVNEADGSEGLLDLEIKLDKPAPTKLNITYSIDGSALDSVYAFEQNYPTQYYDYYIDGESGKTSIAAGETSGKISLQLLTDFQFEDDETIEITLTGGDVAVASANKMTITLQQQDGKVIALLWDDDNDADMDLFLWAGDDSESLNSFIASSAAPNSTGSAHIEALIIPDVDFIKDWSFGLSHIYYSGTVNPLDFSVQFADFKDGTLEALADRDVKNGTYSLANINAYDNTTTGTEVQIEQTFDRQFTAISEITTPTSGSRVKANKIPASLKRRIATPSISNHLRFH